MSEKEKEVLLQEIQTLDTMIADIDSNISNLTGTVVKLKTVRKALEQAYGSSVPAQLELDLPESD